MSAGRGWLVAVAVWGVSSTALAQDAGAPPPSSTEPAPIDLYTPPPPAPKEPEVERTGPGGFELGLRLDAELPFGEAFSGTRLKSMTSSQVALRLELGWRITPRWQVAAFAGYGLAFVNGCTENVSCSAHDVRVGLGGQLHLRPGEAVDPWIGLGAGYEWLSLSSSTSAVSTDVTFEGPTFALLDVGADFRLGERAAVGPFLEASAGQLRSTETGDLAGKRAHLWVGLGVRGWFDVR